MVLEQPFRARLAGARRVLLVGAGGGYDILGGIPILVDLSAAGKEVHLAGVSFTSLAELGGTRVDDVHPDLFAVPATCASDAVYCPEAWLMRWLRATTSRDIPFWGVRKSGARPQAALYSTLVQRLGIDAIVLIDGGVDLILRGDESSIGTPGEDLCTLAALRSVACPVKLIACLGFGTELRDGIRHAQVLERVAELQRAGGFLGTSTLMAGTAGGEAYRQALRFVFENQQAVRTSHVQSEVLAAMDGAFGPRGENSWVSPLTPIYWFFDLESVASSHLFLGHVADTNTIWDATNVIRACRKALVLREPTTIPL